MFLLDTNVISQRRKARPDANVLAWLGTLAPEAMFVSVAALMEIQKGVEMLRTRNAPAADELEQWLDELSATEIVLDVTPPVARAWGKLLAGTSPRKAIDALVAATAMVHGLTVATRNVADFQPFDVRVLNPFAIPSA